MFSDTNAFEADADNAPDSDLNDSPQEADILPAETGAELEPGYAPLAPAGSLTDEGADSSAEQGPAADQAESEVPTDDVNSALTPPCEPTTPEAPPLSAEAVATMLAEGRADIIAAIAALQQAQQEDASGLQEMLSGLGVIPSQLRTLDARFEKFREFIQESTSQEMLKSLIRIYDILKMLAPDPQGAPIETEEFQRRFAMLEQQLLQELSRQRVHPMDPCEGDPFDPTIHATKGRTLCDDPERDGTVAVCHRVGFAGDTFAIRPAEVHIYVYEPRQDPEPDLPEAAPDAQPAADAAVPAEPDPGPTDPPRATTTEGPADEPSEDPPPPENSDHAEPPNTQDAAGE